MSNILDYMNWRGDITFAKDKFNDIDALILSCVSYVNLDGIVQRDRRRQREPSGVRREIFRDVQQRRTGRRQVIY